MYCRKSKKSSNGRVYLSFVQGYRENGKVKQKTIEKIGYLDDLEKIYDDPFEHFKEVAKERTLLETPEKRIEISLLKRLPDETDNRRNLGYAVVKDIYHTLDIRGFLQKKQRTLNIKYNLNSIFSLLTFDRFLFPSSKKHAFDTKQRYFEKFDFSLDDVYRSLDYFAEYSESLQQHLHHKVCGIAGRENSLAYYDVTNYYFEIPYEDDDEEVVLESGKTVIKKGARKRGPSKENRKDPIIQMGLLMDSKGIPMSFNIFSGGESEKTSLLPTVRRVKRDFSLEKIIIVADRGLNTSDNTAFLSGKNHDDMEYNDGYVYGQSVLGADKDFKAWVLKKDDYIVSREKDKNGEEVLFTHKSRIYAKKIKLKNDDGNRKNGMEIYQKQMVYYSAKYAKKQKKDREKTLRKAMDLIANPGKYTKATSYGATGYINNIKFVKSTGEIPDGLDLSLNIKKIEEEEKYDGYYSIVTSEKHLSDSEIRDIYKGLWEIEESFKIIKSEFKGRPMFVQTLDHIEAHFLVCFVALLIMRILEIKVDGAFTIKQIRNSLINYSCSHLDLNYYLFDFRNDVLRALEKILDVDLGKKIMSVSEIKNILKLRK